MVACQGVALLGVVGGPMRSLNHDEISQISIYFLIVYLCHYDTLYHNTDYKNGKYALCMKYEVVLALSTRHFIFIIYVFYTV